MYICMCVQIYVFMYIALRKNYEEDKYHIKDRVLLNFLFNLEKSFKPAENVCRILYHVLIIQSNNTPRRKGLNFS